MAKTVFSDTPPLGTIVTALFLNLMNNHRHAGTDTDGDGALDYAVATGSANAYAIALAPVLTANSQGMPVRFKANFTNSGPATLAINGMAAIPLKKNVNVALAAGDIQSGQIYTACFDGTNYQVLELILGGLGAPNLGMFMNAAGTGTLWGHPASVTLATRDMTAANGNVQYTGATFQPSIVITFAMLPQAPNSGWISICFGNYGGFIGHVSTYNFYGMVAQNANIATAILQEQDAVIVSYDPDGHTLSWTKYGTPTGTAFLMFLNIR